MKYKLKTIVSSYKYEYNKHKLTELTKYPYIKAKKNR